MWPRRCWRAVTSVVGLDSLNDYYDVRLKQARLDRLRARAGFGFHHLDVSDKAAVGGLVADHGDLSGIVHLAAQAGVRHSLVDPYAYVQANVMGHLVVLEAARRLPGLRHLVYASTSSVYGANTEMPFRETDRVDQPVSLYAATKRADELMSHAYAHLFGLPQTGLRFFTVYGPWGRPDMAYFSFARAIVAGEPITLYDEGRLRRDFTYIDDIVAGVVGSLDRPPEDPHVPRLLNIGNHRVEEVRELVRLLEEASGPEGDYPVRATAVGGCGGDVCLGGCDRGADRIFSGDATFPRSSAVCGVVPGVGGGLNDDWAKKPA